VTDNFIWLGGIVKIWKSIGNNGICQFIIGSSDIYTTLSLKEEFRELMPIL
jgi:hypothetical protein